VIIKSSENKILMDKLIKEGQSIEVTV
jgi:hypothetical protein